ncbi:MAG: endonuclease/exonuclease/phosphatase family protein, partial [Thiohalomonas sp.]|nr:endonuclease/exonuclease/phosphatase family protein [Thiohalomonas sp.]
MLEAGDVESNPGPRRLTHDLSILHLNIRSIRNKLDYIKDNYLDFDILTFSETHLEANVLSESLVLSDNFSEPYRRDRNSHGGGVAIYLSKELIHCRRQDLENFWDESIWIELKVNIENYLIGLFYSPKSYDQIFFNNLNLNIEKAFHISKNIIILGDMN